MNNEHTEERLRPHPAMGGIAVERAPMSEVMRETVSDQEVDDMKKKLEKTFNATQPMLVSGGPSLMNALNELMGTAQPLDIPSDAEIRTALEEQGCKFEVGIVVEVGPMPPGYPDLDFDKGNRVFYHEGAGHKIGEITILSVDKIIGWD